MLIVKLPTILLPHPCKGGECRHRRCVRPLCSYVIATTLAVLLLASCGDRARQDNALLATADSLLGVSPGSALSLADSLLATGRGSSHWMMQLRLRRLNAQNKLDTVFTSRHVDEAKTLTEHFDRHGTPNERMLAHYLLGRTYADTHEAPMALEAFHDAVDCADTTAADCDFRQLCFVYTQMANILYSQHLYRDELSTLDLAVKYGYLAADTLNALLAYTQKMGAYYQLMIPDSMLFVSETVSRLLACAGYTNLSAAVLANPIEYLVLNGDTTKAQLFLNRYERESGYFDNEHNIEPGREVFYYTKGMYYQAVHQYDSAEYFFRKELYTGKDFNNQNAGSYGLAKLFMLTHHSDSAAKYALYSYAMNDSAYDQETMYEVARLKSLHDYSRYQKEALLDKVRAGQYRSRLVIAFLLIIIVSTFVAIIFSLYIRQTKRKSELQNRYNNLREQLRREQEELTMLKIDYKDLIRHVEAEGSGAYSNKGVVPELSENSASDCLFHQIDHLESVIAKKHSEIVLLTARTTQLQLDDKQLKAATSKERVLLNEEETYRQLVALTLKGKYFEPEDWETVEALIKRSLPVFHSFIREKKQLLTIVEYHICLLRRIYIRPRAIAFAVKKDPSDITHLRRSLNLKLFGVDGNSKDFDNLLWSIGTVSPPNL